MSPLSDDAKIRLRNYLASGLKGMRQTLKLNLLNEGAKESVQESIDKYKNAIKSLESGNFDDEWLLLILGLIDRGTITAHKPPERLEVPQNQMLNELARGMLSGPKVINISKKKYGTTWESSLTIWYDSPQTATKKDTLLTKPLLQGSHTILMIWLAYYHLTGLREVIIPLEDYMKLTASTNENAARQNFDLVSSILLSQTILLINTRGKKRINIFDSMHMDFKAKSVTLKVSESFAAKCYGYPTMSLPPEFPLVNARIQPTAKPIMYKLAEHLATNEGKTKEYSIEGKISVQKLCEYLNLPPYIVNGKKSRRHKEERRDPLEAGLNSSTKIEWSYDREIKKPNDFEDAYVCYKLLQ